MDKLLAFLVAFVTAVALMPFIIFLAKKLKLRQTVLHYVTEHKAKSGTPTLGGIGFILPLLTCFIFAKGDKSLMTVALVVTIGYGIVGFLDDFIKVFFKRNDGLSPIQKIIFQLLIAVIVAFFAYYNRFTGSVIYSFFSFKEIDLGWFSIPLYVFMFLLMTNSVNLTDGLDGLAGGVTTVYTAVFTVILTLFVAYAGNGQAANEAENLIIFCCCLLGGLIGFLCFNAYPAKIFMGDTGSLALGGALATLAIFSRRILIVPILGIMYMLSSISVIIQVLYFKKTKKRIFLMAPLHHHFQKKGIHESKITFLYSVITLIMGALILIVMLVVQT